MSTKREVKVGDKVKSLVTEESVVEGRLYEVVTAPDEVGDLQVKDDDGDTYWLFKEEFEPVKDEPKGTFESLLIEALPQGGYEVTAPGSTWGVHHQKLSAHTTLAEAVAFVSRNMR